MASTLCSRLRVLLNILILLLFTAISNSTNSNSDLNTLLSFKSLITKDPMGALSSWDTINKSVPNGAVSDFCRWNGVTCNSSLHGSHVTALRLRSFGLEGNISESLGNLSHLEILDLSNNKLEGEIPSSIGNFVALHFLNLSVNHLSGNIPQSIGRLSKLEILNVRHNNIIGSIPTSVLNLTKLTMLSASDNYLAGKIPDWLGNLTTLTDLNFGWNSFRGQIPRSLGKLTNLVNLTMPGNQLEGIIPPPLFNISSLELFNLGYNKLSGSLPPDIGFTLPNVRKFGVYYNNFEGPVPSSLSNISVLQQLILHGNRFHGRIPPNIGVHGSLTTLELGNNLLQAVDTKDWDFLTSLVNCSNLRFLNLELNNMSGILPNTVSNLSHEVTWLQMGTNQITGTIPSGIGRFHKLLVLDLSDNLFTSTIPSSIGKLSSLDQLLLFRNKFDGEIPSSLGNLTKLSELVLFSNGLHGSMPTSLGNMSILASMDLSYNQLSGQIPQEILSMPSLTKLLNLSNNLFSGHISRQIGHLFSLGIMDLSDNNLSGEVPHTLGSCVALQFLYLQGNHLQGQIPMELNALRGLEVLDISSNNLSGPIPDFLGDFQVLKKLNLSFNNLSGPVLDHGIFCNVTSVSLSGNVMLCGGPRFFEFPLCSTQATYGRSKHQPMHILIFCFVGVGALVAFVCILVCYFMKKASRKVSDAEQGLVTLPKNKYKRISYAELYEATNSFSDSNLIGRGRFGTVYKGILHDDSNTQSVAVKVLDLKQQGASRTFFTECDALRRIKHRNLVKVITVCDGLDNYGDEFKALVLEFISNGTLDEWLHPGAPVTKKAIGRLSLIQRLNIALDVAEALAYLHHHSNPSIVHCDIKPSNILLDDNMTAHVGDFGLARILNMDPCGHNSGGSSSAGIQGTIGYLAPEYAMGQRVGVEAEVYSYGVLLLEILTELRPTDTSFDGATSLVKHVEMAYPYRLQEILDATMLQGSTSHSTQEMTDIVIVPVVRIGLACCRNAASKRIRMDEVVKELKAIQKTWQDHFAKIPGATGGAADGVEIH